MVTVLQPRVLSMTVPALNENKLSYDCNAIRLLVRRIYTKREELKKYRTIHINVSSSPSGPCLLITFYFRAEMDTLHP
jgi:hypothetical protein